MPEIETSVRITLDSPAGGKIVLSERDSPEKAAIEFEEAKARIERELAPYTPEERHRAVMRLQRQYDEEVKRLEVDRDEKKRRVSALETLQIWFDKPPALVLEKNDCTRLHRLKEAAASGRVIGSNNESLEKSDAVLHVEHTFVVRHNWSAAFEHAEGIADEFRFPYDICAFEFRIDGHNVIAVACEAESKRFTSLVEIQDYWYAYGSEKNASDPLVGFMWAQMRAICIALDAEVATSTVIRAPHALNEKREKQRKPKVVDFHVVDLAKRHRVANPSGAVGGGGRKRLHFRRGHWRHYETSKTWVRWCLVGDPDLGFIQKSYTL